MRLQEFRIASSY